MNISPIWITLDGYEPGRGVERFIESARPYGVILFTRHVKSTAQLQELCQCVREASEAPRPLLALDQEGGRVNRLAPLGYHFPGAEELKGDPERVGMIAFEMGQLLAELGFDADFAPVADLGPAHTGTGLEGRLYGLDADVVTTCCAAFLEGLERAGLKGCLKHFPGLGGSRVNSHESLPVIAGEAKERRRHLEPYLRLSRSLSFVMVAHAAYSCYGEDIPASLNPAVYELLREGGYEGKAITDDLAMGAVSALDSLEGLILACLEAGADVALWVSEQETTLRALEALRKEAAFVASSRRL